MNIEVDGKRSKGRPKRRLLDTLDGDLKVSRLHPNLARSSKMSQPIKMSRPASEWNKGWRRSNHSKTNVSFKEVIELDLYGSLAGLNEGRITLVKIIDLMNCPIGFKCYENTVQTYEERITMAKRAKTVASKEAPLSKKVA